MRPCRTKDEVIKSMRDAWSMTKQRCLNPKQRDYGRYGGRGVTICARWMEFSNFLEDMGLRPEGMTLEREDNNRGYEPGNCVWAPRKKQARNREVTLKITYKGSERSVAEWSEITGIPYYTLKARLTRLGYSPEDCLEKPVKPGARVKGREYQSNRTRDSYLPKLTSEQVLEALTTDTPSSELAKRFGVSPATIRSARNRTTYRWVNAPC